MSPGVSVPSLLLVWVLVTGYARCPELRQEEPEGPDIDELPVELRLQPEEYLTAMPYVGHNASARYLLPDHHFFSTLDKNYNPFGVRASGGTVSIKLYDASGLFPPIEFVLNTPAGECLLLTHGLDEGEEMSGIWVGKRCARFSRDYFHWFLLERTRDYIALYNLGYAQPLLDYDNYNSVFGVNFNTYYVFSVSSWNSDSDSEWDFNADGWIGFARGIEAVNPFVTYNLLTMQNYYLEYKEPCKRPWTGVGAYRNRRYWVWRCNDEREPLKRTGQRLKAALAMNNQKFSSQPVQLRIPFPWDDW